MKTKKIKLSTFRSQDLHTFLQLFKGMGRQSLRDLCKRVGVSSRGTKNEMMSRVWESFADAKDQGRAILTITAEWRCK